MYTEEIFKFKTSSTTPFKYKAKVNQQPMREEMPELEPIRSKEPVISETEEKTSIFDGKKLRMTK